MARLNEPPALGESLEALKRRFIRQNREIARANSTQSTKIRTLECETSRLLSENITLREENIRLQKALKEERRQNGSKNISVFKNKFESKVQELNELLLELTRTSEKDSPSPGHARTKSMRQSLYQRHRPTTAELAEIAIAEGRLAPIEEDKASPRRAFERGEIQISIPDWSNISDSPELGPPPVAHFDDGDPIKQSASEAETARISPFKSAGGQNDFNQDPDFLSSNFETRRRRRESANTKDNTGEEFSTSTEDSAQAKRELASSQSLKTGAKRKFSAREDESKPLAKSISQQDLAASRRRDADSASSRPLSRSKSHVNMAAALTIKEKSQPIHNTATQSRKALGDKPVNTDPIVSPVRTRQLLNDKPSDPKKDVNQKPRDRVPPKEKSNIRQIRPIRSISDALRASVQENEVPPKTPAPLDDDIFSPGSHPSTARAESRDTPPPVDLQSSATNAAARPARRQRSAVSYAEPNLRDKMRRPGKDLADAVSGVPRSRISMSDLSANEYPCASTVTELPIPRADHVAPSEWSATKEPTSPLITKSTTIAADPSTIQADVLADPRRLTSASHRRTSFADEPPERRVSASQETIAALISSSNKKLARIGSSTFDVQPSMSLPSHAIPPSSSEVSGLAESLSVFDLHLSSPTTEDAARIEKSKPRGPGGRTTKRHSSVSEGLSRLAKETARTRERERKETEEVREDDRRMDEGSGMGNGSGSLRRAERAERRRSMMI